MDNHEQVLSRLREDILLRGLSQHTLESYTINVRIFLDYCNRPADQIQIDDIRHFLQHLLHEKKSSPGTVNAYSAAIRFLFAVTLNRTLNYLQIPRLKKRKSLPEVLSRDEVSSLIAHCSNLKHKAMLMVIYSAGLRISEAAALKIQHIDSKSMRIFVACGKGGKRRPLAYA